MHIQLIKPNEQYKNKILDYKAEFVANNEVLHGSAGLDKIDNFEEWYRLILQNSSEHTVMQGLVPASTFIAVDENDEIVGMIDIRHRLNDFLFKQGGHIGYSVRKSQRRKGYATKMLSMALDVCKSLGIEKCLITCDKTNIASARTIMKSGGILENEIIDGEEIISRYWISL
ncbi:MAG: GNAT family N-acetyltransferase [Peptoanaerobacter stomatis]|uniref:GNAT family N-acetyltransferase n=1 Tax=Peptoanaerobacter stomatis TaxID=796937 RepID=UPI003FA05C99